MPGQDRKYKPNRLWAGYVDPRNENTRATCSNPDLHENIEISKNVHHLN